MTPVQQIEKIKTAFSTLREAITELEASLLDWADEAAEAEYPVTRQQAPAQSSEPALTPALTPANEAAPATPAPPVEPTYSLEEARQVLATYAKAGHTTAVKNGLTQVGANRLSDVPEARLNELIQIVEGLIG
ncbi:hypothetical protein X956_03970 [Trueperella pyogenes TP8]|uniref:hypothetical protein n=1 Tax=Trueperella pyogenes TaxID=1661 RepID=UPI00058206B1|nr:hypothetical protein [Trueperella pyogenes]AJC69351.1 hypothetical protein X956_03970 [Trueperella pyogenes TP8]